MNPILKALLKLFNNNNKKVTVALYFGRILTRFGVVHFRVFRLCL